MSSPINRANFFAKNQKVAPAPKPSPAPSNVTQLFASAVDMKKVEQNAQLVDAERLRKSVAVLIAQSILNPRGLFAVPKKPTPGTTNNTPTLKR
ncbi:MAG TPA: hypothetical protein VJK30_02150 [Coxiellaceae bacterium]|nr:MAG: hypothetical protein A3E81_03790 [Gammaproteobacteria bacterium RIFCSPHIGHO2_12_FULL_36_30]HLB56122.1 hypothetical protein [Coxiellaceae bacterium]